MNANGKIKGYKITLTLAGGTTEDVVTDAEFSTTTMWQKASFDAVENVTAVRLTVLSSAGPERLPGQQVRIRCRTAFDHGPRG